MKSTIPICSMPWAVWTVVGAACASSAPVAPPSPRVTLGPAQVTRAGPEVRERQACERVRAQAHLEFAEGRPDALVGIGVGERAEDQSLAELASQVRVQFTMVETDEQSWSSYLGYSAVVESKHRVESGAVALESARIVDRSLHDGCPVFVRVIELVRYREELEVVQTRAEALATGARRQLNAGMLGDASRAIADLASACRRILELRLVSAARGEPPRACRAPAALDVSRLTVAIGLRHSEQGISVEATVRTALGLRPAQGVDVVCVQGAVQARCNTGSDGRCALAISSGATDVLSCAASGLR